MNDALCDYLFAENSTFPLKLILFYSSSWSLGVLVVDVPIAALGTETTKFAEHHKDGQLEIRKKNLHGNTKGSALFFDVRTGYLRTKTYKRDMLNWVTSVPAAENTNTIQISVI